MEKENRGYIEITEKNDGTWNVKARLINGNVWMTQYRMARLFGVYESTVRNNLRAIFKSGVLSESDVTPSDWNGQSGLETLYNLEAIIYVSFRVATYQARAFRQWVLHALHKYYREEKPHEATMVLVYDYCRQRSEHILN